MTPKVRVMLDVDGCVNAAPADLTALMHLWEVRDAKISINCGGGLLLRSTITYAPAWGEFFTELDAIQEVEIVWLTTWGHLANQKISPLLGMPCFRVLAEESASKIWWKLDAVRDAWNQDQVPFVWIDDEIPHQPIQDWTDTVDCLLISPDTTIGLHPDHLTAIRHYIDNKIGV